MTEHFLRCRKLALVCIALQAIATLAIAARECLAQSGPTLVAQALEALPPPAAPLADERFVP